MVRSFGFAQDVISAAFRATASASASISIFIGSSWQTAKKASGFVALNRLAPTYRISTPPLVDSSRASPLRSFSAACKHLLRNNYHKGHEGFFVCDLGVLCGEISLLRVLRALRGHI
jgi:hypothetical protein